MSTNDLPSGGDAIFEPGSPPDSHRSESPGLPAAPAAGAPAAPARDAFAAPAASGPDVFGMPTVPAAPDAFAVPAASAPEAVRMPAALVADASAGPTKPARRPARIVVLALLVAIGLAGVGGGGAALARELTRPATKAEQAAALQEEIASRWQRLSAGKIFMPALSYTTGGLGASFNATLVGIAPPASCAAALDPALANLLRRYGCVTVLRATYLDYSGTEAVTIGLVVMKSTGAGNRAVANSASLPASAGIRTFPLPGTVAAQFGDAQRRYFSTITSIGTYVFLTVAGFTDGRVSGSGSSVPSLSNLGQGVTTSLETVLTHHGSACSMKDIRC